MSWSNGRSAVALCVMALAAPALVQAQGAPQLAPAQPAPPAPALILKGHTGDLAGAAFSPDGTKGGDGLER